MLKKQQQNSMKSKKHDNISLISRDQDLKQIFRETIEIKKKNYSRIIPQTEMQVNLN